MKLLLKPILIAAVLGSASFALAAETPFAGTWKLNLDKSKLTGDTVKFSSAFWNRGLEEDKRKHLGRDRHGQGTARFEDHLDAL